MLKYLYPMLKTSGIDMKDEFNRHNATFADKCDMCGDDAPSSSGGVINFLYAPSHIERFIDGMPLICHKCGMVLNGAGKVNGNLYEYISESKRIIIHSDGNTHKAILDYKDLFKQKPGAFFFFYSRRLSLDFERITVSPKPDKNIIVNFYNHPNYLQRYPLFPDGEVPAWARKGYGIVSEPQKKKKVELS